MSYENLVPIRTCQLPILVGKQNYIMNDESLSDVLKVFAFTLFHKTVMPLAISHGTQWVVKIDTGLTTTCLWHFH